MSTEEAKPLPLPTTKDGLLLWILLDRSEQKRCQPFLEFAKDSACPHHFSLFFACLIHFVGKIRHVSRGLLHLLTSAYTMILCRKGAK